MLSIKNYITKYKVLDVCISYDEIEALIPNNWIGQQVYILNLKFNDLAITYLKLDNICVLKNY
jgi:hypothetical protein